MATRYADLRSATLEHLRGGQEGVVDDSTAKAISAILVKRGLAECGANDYARMEQIFHELYLQQIIVPCGSGMVSSEIGNMLWPKYKVTEYGRAVLGKAEYVPYDPDGYLKQLRKEIPEIDPVIVAYLEEALECLRHGCLLAAAITTGCAAEKALLQFIDVFGTTIIDAGDAHNYQNEVKARNITQKYAAMWKRLERLTHSLPQELAIDLHVNLDRIFELIRTARNEAGHPTGNRPTRERVQANFLLFPNYCKQVYGLLNHFSHRKV
ncbi:MAG: hypothetical protein NTZ09_01975 [Candidatus Hydrogenedentes bacterium]|nr:hypothetical protein [Candidatus Hydrogenedentota bacterium]